MIKLNKIDLEKEPDSPGFKSIIHARGGGTAYRYSEIQRDF